MDNAAPLPRTRRGNDADCDDIFAEEVTQALIGITGILGLLVVITVTASVVIATTMLRHL